jgi:hypothetical protein
MKLLAQLLKGSPSNKSTMYEGRLWRLLEKLYAA